ncbi:TonB-dependent siderophore receptor [Robbsia andropogonis]|uniref:TonB-dependent siderophore receptor n=1 Tax=Robbsia andropogonis TaxID=28092 RepID=UPI0004660463|nr:TonB-dependent siderophore receptor [Robbsia andropogonis]
MERQQFGAECGKVGNGERGGKKGRQQGMHTRLRAKRTVIARHVVSALTLAGAAAGTAMAPGVHAQANPSNGTVDTGSTSSAASTSQTTSAMQATVNAALPTVAVTGKTENPKGPGVGYVATRSMTGTKTDSSLMTNPQSVSVVTRQQMDDQGAMTVDQALRYTPGVYTQDGTDIRSDQIRGRGFTLDSYLDGLKLQASPRFSTPRVDAYLMERMDILHGPSSVLYGSANPGGLVNFVSKLPTETPYHEIMLQIGNHNTYQIGYDFSGPVDKNGTILYRITGIGRTAETQVSAIKDQRIAIAPSVTIRPSRDTSLTLQGGYQRDPNGGLFNPVPASGTILPNPNGSVSSDRYLGDASKDGMHRSQYWLGYQFQHGFNDTFSVSQNARYLFVDQRYYQTSVGAALLNNGATAPMYGNVDQERYSQFEIDTHATAKYATGQVQHTTLFGLDYQRASLNDATNLAQFVGNTSLFNPNYGSLSSVHPLYKDSYSLSQVGVYAQDEARWRNWVLTYGIREDWAGTDQNYRLISTGNSIQHQHADDHAFTWRVGLAYEFNNGIAPYISYAKSFAPVLGATYSGAAFKPTTGKQTEVGVRYKPTGYDALFTAAFYTLTQNNVTTTDPAHTSSSIQTGQILSRGMDLSANANLTENLKLIASYSYIDQRNTQSTTAFGKRPTIAPRHSASIWADYTLHKGPLRNFGFGGGVRAVSSSAGDDQDTIRVPGRMLVDLSAHYDIQNWRLSINVNNLLDREYISYCTTSYACYWGATRTVLGTARYQW